MNIDISVRGYSACLVIPDDITREAASALAGRIAAAIKDAADDSVSAREHQEKPF